MICTCQFCKQPFWRYRRDWPPKGFCSWPCSLTPAEPIVTVPELPGVILHKLRQHHSFAHSESSILSWPDCETCEQIERDYNESLNFHFQQAQAAVYAAANSKGASL